MLKYLKIYVVVVLFLSIPLQNKAQNTDGKFTNLGPQVFTSLIQGSVFADDSKGERYVYTVVRGRPARFVGFSLKPLTKVVEAELPGTDGSWDVEVSSDGIVYIAGNGMIYKYIPGQDGVTDLGVVLPGEKVIWDLKAGKGGEIFGGTYPGCRVFRYHPADGFSDVTNGPVLENENYVRSIAYHKATGKIFAGIASHSALVEIDIKTGAKKQLLADRDRDQEAIYNLSIVEGTKGGDRVFGWLTGALKRVTVVYNIRTKKFEENLPTIDVRSVIKAPKSSKVFYSAGKKLYVIDYASKDKIPMPLVDLQAEIKTTSWGKDGLLYMLSANQYVQTYNPKTGKLISQKLDVPTQAIDIQSIGVGPDGLIWSAGYLAGSHATYNPETGKNIQHPGLDQTEGMTNLGASIYFGIYAKSRLYSFDTRKPWDVKANNPKFLGQIKGQDRPFAVLGLEKLNKVLFGTVPTYGQLGGAIIDYDVAADKLETFNNIMPNHSIVSLIAYKDEVIGGTSIFGGLGGLPTEKEGKIFGWDPILKKITYEIVPVPGAMAVTGLITGPDGRIWGFADGDLIVFDPVTRTVTSKYKVFEMYGKPSHIWRSASMVVHPSGNVYVAVNNKLHKIDPNTMEISKIADNVGLLSMDKKGRLYFKRNSDLWRYNP